MSKKNMFAKFRILIAMLILLILFSATAYSHPGRTDANGGHYVRTAGWGYPIGSYHYHNNTTTTKPVTYPKPTQNTNQLVNTTDSQNSGNLFLTLFVAFVVFLWPYLAIELVIIQKTDKYMSDNKNISKEFKKIVLTVLRIMAVLTSLYVSYFFLNS